MKRLILYIRHYLRSRKRRLVVGGFWASVNGAFAREPYHRKYAGIAPLRFKVERGTK